MTEDLGWDLGTFVAGVAVERGEPLAITCNCGGVITIMPPLQEDLVVCAKCESRIKILVVSGDPGFIVGRAPNGDPMLIPVQGSTKKKLNISAEEQRRIVEKLKEEWKESEREARPHRFTRRAN